MTSRSSERMTSVSESAMLWRSGIAAAYLGPGLRAAGPSRTVAPIPSASRARAARADASSPAEASVLKMTSSTRAVRVLAVGPGFSRGAGSEGGDCGCSCSGVAGGRPKLPKGAAAVTALSLSADAAGPPGGQTAAKDRVCGTAPPISDAPLPAMISADINMRTGHAVRREMVCRASRSKLLSSASTSKRRTGRLNCPVLSRVLDSCSYIHAVTITSHPIANTRVVSVPDHTNEHAHTHLMLYLWMIAEK